MVFDMFVSLFPGGLFFQVFFFFFFAAVGFNCFFTRFHALSLSQVPKAAR